MNTDISETIKKYYFVNYQDRGQASLDGIENLSEKDKVIIFHKKEHNISLSFLKKIHASKAEIKLQESDCEHLMLSYISYIMGKNPDSTYHFITDKGYWGFIEEFWSEKDVNIRILPDIKSE